LALFNNPGANAMEALGALLLSSPGFDNDVAAAGEPRKWWQHNKLACVHTPKQAIKKFDPTNSS
jgi:hypothetical protein